jgi:hypothetical protein
MLDSGGFVPGNALIVANSLTVGSYPETGLWEISSDFLAADSDQRRRWAHSPFFVNQARADSGSRLAELQVAIGAESEPLLPTTSHG